MLDYFQPILKKDLYQCVGTVSDDKKYELIDMVTLKLGVSSADTEVAATIDTEYKEGELTHYPKG